MPKQKLLITSKSGNFTARPCSKGHGWLIRPTGGKTKVGEYFSNEGGWLSMAYGGWVFKIKDWPDLMDLFLQLDNIDKTRLVVADPEIKGGWE